MFCRFKKLSEQHENLSIELNAEREARALSQTTTDAEFPRVSNTYDSEPGSATDNKVLISRATSLPMNFESRKRSNFSLPIIDDIDEEVEEQEEVPEKSPKSASSFSIDTEAVSPRRPSSGKSSRKRGGSKSKQLLDSTSEMKPTQPLNKVGKSPRKIHVQEVTETAPVVTTVETGTSIDLNLTRLSRIHRFIQTDMYSTEYGGLVNQVADLTTELEERDKLIVSLKKDIQVIFTLLISE